MTIRFKLGIYTLIATIILLAGFVLILWPAQSKVPSSIGTSLVASGIVVVLDLVYRRIIDEDAIATKAILRSGLTNIYDRRDIDKYHSLMKSLSSRLDVSGYSLRSFHDSFAQILTDHLHKNRGLKVRLLVVNPDSAQSRAREASEGLLPGTFSASVARLKGSFAFSGNVEIRSIDTELTTTFFRLDDTMFVGPQFLSLPSRATFTMEVHKGQDSWLFKSYETEFRSMWDGAHVI